MHFSNPRVEELPDEELKVANSRRGKVVNSKASVRAEGESSDDDDSPKGEEDADLVWSRHFNPSKAISTAIKRLIQLDSQPKQGAGFCIVPTEDVKRKDPLMLSWKRNDTRPLGENLVGIKHGRRETNTQAFSFMPRSSLPVPCLEDDCKISTSLTEALRDLSLGTAASLVRAAETRIGRQESCFADPRAAFEMSLLHEKLARDAAERKSLRRKEGDSLAEPFEHVFDQDAPQWPGFDENSAFKRVRVETCAADGVVDRSVSPAAKDEDDLSAVDTIPQLAAHRQLAQKRPRN